MYFIDIKGLKKDIIEKNFTEHDRFTYIVVYLLLDTLVMEISSYFPTDSLPTLFDYASSLVAMASVFFGAYFIYQANGANSGEDFAGKFFSITWVRGIQFLLILIPIAFVFGFLNEAVLHLSPLNDEIVSFIIFSGGIFAIYFYAYRDVLEIKAHE